MNQLVLFYLIVEDNWNYDVFPLPSIFPRGFSKMTREISTDVPDRMFNHERTAPIFIAQQVLKEIEF